MLVSIKTECILVFYHLWVSTERKWSFTESLRCFYIMMMENILWCPRIQKLKFLLIPHALFVRFSFRSNHIDMRRLERELYEVNLLRKQAIDDQEYVYLCSRSLPPLHVSQIASLLPRGNCFHACSRVLLTPCSLLPAFPERNNRPLVV